MLSRGPDTIRNTCAVWHAGKQVCCYSNQHHACQEWW